MPNEIYKFLKQNNLTTKSESDFISEYSNPEKAKELHGFMQQNNLTTKDSAQFYDTYFKPTQPQKPQLTSSGIPDFSAIVKKSLTPDLKANINPMKAVKGIGVPSKEVAVNIPIKTVEGTFKVPDKLLSPDTITEEQQTLQLPTVTPEVLPLNELLTKGTDYTRQYLQSKKDATQVDFEQQSDVNNVVGAFNREAQVYQKTQEQLKQYADKYEKSLGFRYGSDFIAKMKQERDVLQGEISQFEKYSTKRTAEFQKLNAELEDIQTRYQNGEISEQEAKPAYEAKVAQMKAIEADITSKQQPIKDKQSAFDAKLQDEDFKSYLTVNNKLDEIQNEAQSLITRPEFKEYRDLLDAGDREQAKKDAVKKAMQKKGILAQSADALAFLGNAILNPFGTAIDLAKGTSKTYFGSKITDEGDKLLGRTLKALASVPKMTENINPIGDANNYDIFDKVFDQALEFSKKRDILNPVGSDVQRDIKQSFADVNGYKVLLDNGKPTGDVRDANFFKVDDKTKKEVQQAYAENPSQYKTESDFSVSTLATKATPTILDMGTMMAVTAGTGGSSAVMVGTSAAQMYSDIYESGLQAGLKPSEANDFATLTSIMTGMVTLVNPMEANIVKGVASKNIGKILGSSITKADIQLIRSGEMTIGQLAKRTAIEGLKNTAGENLEELVLEPFVQKATETLYNGKAQKQGGGFETDWKFLQSKEDAETAMITTMTSLLLTPIEVANSIPEQRRLALQRSLENPEQFLTQRNLLLESDGIDKAKFDYEVKAFEEISKQYNAIKPEIKEDLHDDLAELLLKKYTLKNTMAQVGDDILNKKNKVVLDDIDSRLEELVSGTYDKAKETAINNIKENNAPLVADGTAVYNGQEVTIVDDLEDGNVLIDIGNDAIVVPKVELESVDQSVPVINNQNNEQNGKIEEAKGQENVLNTETQVAVDGVGVSPAVTETVETETSTAKPVDKIAKGKTLLAERKLRKKVNENPITPTESVKSGQEQNNSTGISTEKQVDTELGTGTKQGIPTEQKEVQQDTAEVQKEIDSIKQVTELENNPNSPFAKLVNLEEQKTKLLEFDKQQAGNKVEATAKALEGVDEKELDKIPNWVSKKEQETKSKKVKLKDGQEITLKYLYDNTPDNKVAYILGIDKNGNQVSTVMIEQGKNGKWKGNDLEVDKKYRRKGLATAMYDYADEQGHNLTPTKSLKPDGIKFWQKRNKNRAKFITEAYHKAKVDGSNPELVKAVEQSLKETTQSETKVAEKGVEEPLQGKELIGDALDRIASKIGSKKNLTEQERTSLTKDISDLAKGLIQMGSATLDNVIDKIKEAIKKRVPELDDKEVDALANNIEDDVIFKATIDEFKELGLSYEEAKSLLDEDNIDYSEQELKDAWGEEPDDSITPPFDDEKQLQTSDGKLREKAVLNKAYDGEKRDEIKAKIEELNLMYEVENQESVVKKVNDLIEEIGIDAAYESVKNNKDKNAVDAVIFDAKIRSVESEMATATGDRYEELITEQARLYDEMGAVGKDMGRFISMLGHIYRTTDLAYSFARQKELYKSVNNGDFPKAIEIKYRELEEAMKSAQRRISELEKEKKEIEDNYNGAINKDEVNKLIAEAYKSGKNSKKKRNIYSQRKEKVERAKKQIAEGLEDFAKAMGSILSAEGLERPSLTKALVKIGKGLIDGGFATVENVFDKIKDNIKDKFGDTVDIENYKDDVNNALSENSKIKIPNSKIKDIVARRRELGLDTKIEDVVKELQEEYPDYSERDIRDAVSGYGVTKELKPGDDATVRKIKRMGRYESILEDILNKKRPLRTGTQRDKIEADERAKLKEIYQKLKNLPVDATDLSKQLKTAQDAIVAHLENSIEDLDRQIKTGERPEKNKPLETTPEIDALRKRRDELLSIRNNIDNPPKSDLEKLVEKAIDFTNKINQAKKEGKKQDEEWLKKQKELTDGSISNLIDTVIKLNTNPQEVELARKVKAKENEILKLQEKLDNNDLSKQEQKQTITSPELDALIEQKRLLTDELAQRRKSDEEGNLYTNTVNKLQELSDKSADKKIPKEAVKSGLISDLIESYINNGTPLAEIQEKVVNELSSIFPNSDVLQIRDAILRQGDYKTVTKEMSDLRKKIAEFKIQLNLQKKVENARQGVIDIAKTKGESSPELIKARKELAQARKEAVDRFPSASIKNIEKNIRQTQNRINEINRKTKAGEFEKKKQAKKMFMNDPAWKAKFDELKQKNIEKIKAQYEFDLEQEKARMKNRSIPRKSFDFIVDLLGLPKSLVATIDLSAPLRQGIGLGVYNPKEFAKAFWHMHGFAASQKKYDKFFSALKNTEEYQIMAQSGLSITNTTGKADAREDVFMNNLAKKIPIYGIFYKGSERAYSGFLNMLRIDVFNKGVEHLKQQGITFEENPEQYEALARTINNATGRGELGATGEKIARELGLVFFSPRMLTSRVGMVSDIFRPDTPKYARTVAFGNAIGLASYIMTIHALGALIMSAADDEEKGVTFKEVMEKLSFNIIDTDFLKNTYPNKNQNDETTRYDFSTGFSILLRTIARMSIGKKIVKSKKTGEKEERSLRDGGAYRESGADEFSQFIKNKLSPTARVIYSLPVFANQDLDNYKEKFEWGTALKSLVVPLNVKEALGEDNFEWQKKDYHGIPYYSPKTIKGSDWDINQEKYWTDRILSAYGVSIMTY